VFFGIPVISAMDGLCLRIDTVNEADGGGRNLNKTNKIVFMCLISTKANVITLQHCAKFITVLTSSPTFEALKEQTPLCTSWLPSTLFSM
jgi:hypothetical protein